MKELHLEKISPIDKDNIIVDDYFTMYKYELKAFHIWGNKAFSIWEN